MIFDAIRGQLRSVIEWEDPSPQTLFQIWSADADEIKNASKLLVKPGQGVVFLYEGKVEAVHDEPGLYELKTANIPFLTTLMKFMQAFESEHKVGIYFYWKTQHLDQKWGTVSPIKYDDPVYSFPVGLRARGNFTFQVVEPRFFFTQIVGSRDTYSIQDARQAIVARLQTPLVDLFAESGYSYADIDRHREELAEALTDKCGHEFGKLGFQMTDFRIEATDFDRDTVERINRIATLTAEAMAAQKAGLSYAQLQQVEALRDAARNEGGIAGLGVGVGAGMGLGNMFGGAFSAQQPAATPNVGTGEQPPDPAARIKKLKDLLEQGLISDDEFQKRRGEILDSI